MELIEILLLALLCGLTVVDTLGDRKLAKKLDQVLERRAKRQPKADNPPLQT